MKVFSILVSILLCVPAHILKFHLNGDHNPLPEAIFEIPDGFERLSLPEVLITVGSMLSNNQLREQLSDYRIHDALGTEVKKVVELLEGGNFYLVPPNKLWMWPFHHVGARTTFSLDDIQLAVDKPYVSLESVSAIPRLFYLSNFMSASEASGLIQAASLQIKAKTSQMIPKEPGRTLESAFGPFP